MRQIILDTETTGLSAAGGDRILEIGCVELLHRKLTGNNLHFYINPERDSHEDALRVHGITTEFLRDKPKFAAIADELLAYLQGAELVIHNAPFDVGFLNKEFERLGQPPLKSLVANVVDTLVMAKEMYPGKRNSLDALCDRLEVDRSVRDKHGALLDAELLAKVYINLTRGQDALLIDVGDDETEVGTEITFVDLSGIVLPVLQASEEEIVSHQDVLKQMDKSSGGKTVWRNLENNVV
ncbi:DNA polymerase III subunit epsilon [Rhodoferax sp.]|uniref:DNA polymerase III subunit epsilon n=1 Tax=Rhodoferax sp. TaxID=50421 RepID=UPI00374D9D9D